MSKLRNSIAARMGYGFIFIIVIPFLLWSGAVAWEPYMKLVPVYSPVCGGALAVIGLVLMLGSMISLKIQGGGLPMNAFPPPRFVTTGFYRIVPHPIYWGFCLTCAGVSIWFGSSAGLYVITPLSILGCTAIVWGYERRDLIRRFGRPSPTTLLGLPPDTDERPGWLKRITACILMGGFWAIAYYGCAQTHVTEGAPDCRVFGEGADVLSEYFVLIYQSIYLVVPVVLIFLCNTNRRLRHLEQMVYGCFGLGAFLFLMIPFSCPLQEFQPETWAGHALLLDRRELPDCCVAFPSFHVLWALIVARFLWKDLSRNIGLAGSIWACGLSWSCVATGMHGWLDLIGAVCVFCLVANMQKLAGSSLRCAEWLANSWKAWQIGSWRVINHAVYVFLAAFSGYVLVVSLAGPSYLWAVWIVALSSLVGAGLWAQVVEGSTKLLRPFGYYGAVLGGVIGLVLVDLLHPLLSPETCLDGWILFAAMAVSAPWIQAVGRLRCLVQGCCHGQPVPPGKERWGIIHRNPASRVCRLTEWSGRALHATPLYSIALNIVAGWILLRLWCAGMPAGLLVGFYLMLAGLIRFVEEAYRGEPQTRYHAGLSHYQWLSIAFIGTAFIIWNIPSAMVVVPAPVWTEGALIPGVLLGLLEAFCMSTDFPGSNKRFSRLTS